MIDGVKLTLANFLKALGGFNVTVIEAEGQPFDPEIHEAMLQQPSDEHAEPTVRQEVAKGYRLGDRVLRPALVAVSKGGAKPAPQKKPEQDGNGFGGPGRPTNDDIPQGGD